MDMIAWRQDEQDNFVSFILLILPQRDLAHLVSSLINQSN